MFIVVVLSAILFGFLGGLVTNSKNRGWGEGIALGGILGIIGLLVTLGLADKSSQPNKAGE